VKAALCGLLKEEFGAPVPWEQLGEWTDAVILGRYGDVPDDLVPYTSE